MTRTILMSLWEEDSEANTLAHDMDDYPFAGDEDD
jgi:hypothetical protein